MVSALSVSFPNKHHIGHTIKAGSRYEPSRFVGFIWVQWDRRTIVKLLRSWARTYNFQLCISSCTTCIDRKEYRNKHFHTYRPRKWHAVNNKNLHRICYHDFYGTFHIFKTGINVSWRKELVLIFSQPAVFLMISQVSEVSNKDVNTETGKKPGSSVRTRATGECFHIFSSSPKLSRVFLQSDRNSENMRVRRYRDHQNVNTLCSRSSIKRQC